jgi:hypothetical protein
MLSVRALLGCDLFGSEASSSLEEPPKVKTGFFFLRSVGLGSRPIESAGSLDDSSVEEERRAKTPVFLKAVGFWSSAAAMSALGMEDGALRRGMDRYEELTCAGEKPRTTLVVLLSEVPLMDSDDVGCAEVAGAATGASSTVEALDGEGVARC